MGYEDNWSNNFATVTVSPRDPTKATDHNKNRTTLVYHQSIKPPFLPGNANTSGSADEPAVEGKHESGQMFDFWGSFEDGETQTIVDASDYEDATHGGFSDDGIDGRFVSLEMWGHMGLAWNTTEVYPGGAADYKIAGNASGFSGTAAFLGKAGTAGDYSVSPQLEKDANNYVVIQFSANAAGDLTAEVTSLVTNSGLDRFWIYIRATVGPEFTDGT